MQISHPPWGTRNNGGSVAIEEDLTRTTPLSPSRNSVTFQFSFHYSRALFIYLRARGSLIDIDFSFNWLIVTPLRLNINEPAEKVSSIIEFIAIGNSPARDIIETKATGPTCRLIRLSHLGSFMPRLWK